MTTSPDPTHEETPAHEAEVVEAATVEVLGPEDAAASESTESDGTDEQIKALQAALIEAQEQALRRQADFTNYRKRMQRELEDIRKVGRASAIEQFLPVADNFDMAMTAIDQAADLETLKTGMNMIHAELQRCLDGLGVERLDPTGQPFDPNEHEAIKSEPSDEWEEGTVILLYKAGYRLGDRLLRAAVVVVSSGPNDASDA